jgi:hypothetical protein
MKAWHMRDEEQVSEVENAAEWGEGALIAELK